ncbi:hypothetical protein [uncultured Sphingobium sp.]|uniref:hypothetical protein n=1 Tax=uncultured Sphingobium sp. TaxID=316087 RepID=UPI00259B7A3D|nr:hypothetical protein [uncultured Sphingobium sp.]
MGKTIQCSATGLLTRVGPTYSPGGHTGLSFSVVGGTVVVSVLLDGEGHSAELRGDDIDLAAGFFADAVTKATLHDAPSLRTEQ